MIPQEELNRISGSIVDSAFKVHSSMGPGLLENVYQKCMAHELGKHGLRFQEQITLPLQYDGVRLDSGLRLDLLVEDLVVVELKAIESILPVHQAQLLSYMKLARKPLGLLINFNVPLIKDGIQRMAR
ncbi:MAG TPA: GxxExxY protein [Holophagaceae bacterium]|nr:GxxExxY protein [Holophagaceae bacterium]